MMMKEDEAIGLHGDTTTLVIEWGWLPTRTLSRSKVPERATLSAPCGALSPWPSAIGLHGDTTTLVTEWGWRCASWFFEPPLMTYVPHVGTPPVWVQHQGGPTPPEDSVQGCRSMMTYFAQVASMPCRVAGAWAAAL